MALLREGKNKTSTAFHPVVQHLLGYKKKQNTEIFQKCNNQISQLNWNYNLVILLFFVMFVSFRVLLLVKANKSEQPVSFCPLVLCHCFVGLLNRPHGFCIQSLVYTQLLALFHPPPYTQLSSDWTGVLSVNELARYAPFTGSLKNGGSWETKS